jgi:putative Mg2+ transporter-C (MgtC) family protein
MDHFAEIARNLALAWAAGAFVGIERSYNGRAAGFRTHALVALAAAAVAMISFEPLFFHEMANGVRLDPTRLAQGVVTGIGFLGAGVIFKEGYSVQGLTTAASVWACAAIGFLFGLGMWAPASLLAAAALITLTVFSWFEIRAPWKVYAYVVLRFQPDAMLTETEIARLVSAGRVTMSDVSYQRTQGGQLLEFSANLEAPPKTSLAEITHRLCGVKGLIEFELSRISK